MAGIMFFKTRNVKKIREFYLSVITMNIWLEQADCIILKHGNFLLGFCEREECDSAGTITFFYRTIDEVNAMYRKLKPYNSTKPIKNNKYSIYQFLARDPENRTLEFQSFLHPMATYMTGDELLITRRSIREFEPKTIADDILAEIFETCRYSPTSKNSQSYYFLVIRNSEILKYLASLRGSASSPIANSPLAVAVCADSTKTLRPEQDGCIAAYHFMLTAWYRGLGTCWIAAMDRDDVKQTLAIPLNHYVATITPLGYPAKIPLIPSRRKAQEMVEFID